MKETGALKFQDERGEGELALFPGFAELNAARQELRQRGWLGVEESGLGFGNLSLRGGSERFFFHHRDRHGRPALVRLGGLREGRGHRFHTKLAAL